MWKKGTLLAWEVTEKKMCTFLSWYTSAGSTFKGKNLDEMNKQQQHRISKELTEYNQ